SSERLVCRGLVDRLGRSQAEDLPLIVAFCQGRDRGCTRFAKRLEKRVRVVLDGAEETLARYRISRFPTAVVVDGERKIRGYGHPTDIGGIKQVWSRSLAKDSSQNDRERTMSSSILTA